MTLVTDDDLDLEKIAERGQCFRWQKMADGAFRVLHGSGCLYIRPEDGGKGTGAGAGPPRFTLDCTEEEFGRIWRPYLDLDTDYRAVRARIDPGEDPFLAAAAAAGEGIRVLRQDPWETLVSFIISQNRNIPAIRMSVEFLAERAGTPMTDRRGRAYHAFPSPEQVLSLDRDALLACRLGYRWKYVLAAAAAAAEGRLDLTALRDSRELTDRQLSDALTALYGVGPKVASCVILFGLHRLDAFPVDVWIRRVLGAEYPQGYPFGRYSPYNGVYQQYMFAFYRNAR